ncbi:MAG: hypothetical protein JWM32_1273 [Verrucomicrobia bacterium]|nr:hypothetical protein [Verrucomicrobiota bacterium]
MDNFVPGFRDTILSLTVSFRVVVFFVCVAGLLLHLRRAQLDLESLTMPLVRGTVIVGLVAGLPHWFGFTEKVLLSVADTINAGYSEHPMRTAEKMRGAVGDSGTSFSLRRINESFYKAFLWAAAKLVVIVGSLLQLPFLLFQYILKLLCYLFLPVALGLFMIPGLESLGSRYLQQTLAVLAWPIGFAVTELAAYHLLTGYQTNVARLQGITPGDVDASSFASLLGGLLATLWLIIGTLGTPVVMQMLFCSGSPVSSGGPSAMQAAGTVQQLVGIVKTLKTGGAAAPLLAAQAAAKAGKGGGSGTPPLLPPATSATPPRSPAPTNAPPSSKTLIAQTRLPQARTTL